jgi:Photosynthetic reaction centre cytochrome C subunit
MRCALIAVGFLLVSSIAAAQSEVQARMRLWSTALGVQCVHCHIEGAWSDASKPVFPFAQRMMRMVDGINAGPLKDIEPITCWTCHRGQARPARLPRPLWEGIQSAHAADFASKPDVALAMSVYSASLGVECTHCHEAGYWAAATKPAHAMVEKMMPIFDEIPKHFDDTRRPTTQCYMCHQGQRTPERLPK